MTKEEALAIVDRVIVEAEGSWGLVVYGRVNVGSGYIELQFVCPLRRQGTFALSVPVTYGTAAERGDKIFGLIVEEMRKMAAQRDARLPSGKGGGT